MKIAFIKFLNVSLAHSQHLIRVGVSVANFSKPGEGEKMLWGTLGAKLMILCSQSSGEPESIPQKSQPQTPTFLYLLTC